MVGSEDFTPLLWNNDSSKNTLFELNNHRLMKIISLICFLFFLLTAFSQKNKEKILANFDYVEYYPDSTIKEARKFNGINLEGTTVEFNEVGKPVAIGNYKKGKKTGNWIYYDGSSHFFEEKKYEFNSDLFSQPYYQPEERHTGSVRPGCGTGIGQAIGEFYTRYEALLNPENERKFSCWGQEN